MRTHVSMAFLLSPLLLLAGCERPADPVDTTPGNQPAVPTEPAPPVETEPLAAPATSDVTPPAADMSVAAMMARVDLQPTAGSSAHGELILVVDNGGVRMSGHVQGLQPNAEHGFHIHEHGDCSAPDATSAGGHFAPDGQPHGMPNGGPHHAGDMPNLRSDAQGEAHVDLRIERIELGSGGSHDAANRAVVVHASADDYQTQPTGDSGARIACGVIELAQP